jgi:ring-1,2-phenylacetyl-CoA epoxidase subunit PaaB
MPDTQLHTYEVFHQSKSGEPHVHVGAVHASDAALALQYARDQFARRLPCTSLWIVPSDQITATSQAESAAWFDSSTDKSYREASGFPMREIVKRAENWQANDQVTG